MISLALRWRLARTISSVLSVPKSTLSGDAGFEKAVGDQEDQVAGFQGDGTAERGTRFRA